MVLGRAIPVPVVTRWNSLYDALKCLDENRSTLNNLLLCLNVTDKFNEDEFAYLTEYVKIFAPLSSAIDNLQKQRDGFYGHLLPTIYSLLSTIKSQKKLMECIKRSIKKKRFEYLFYSNEKFDEALLAAVLLPEIKIIFLNYFKSYVDGVDFQYIKNLVLKAAEDVGDATTVEKSKKIALCTYN